MSNRTGAESETSVGVRFARACATAAAVVGVGMVLAWPLGLSALVQAGTTSVPIQFNTATAVTFLALSLLAGLYRRWSVAAWLLLPPVALALPALYQEMAGVDLGIDQILFMHTLSAEGVPPGRMAPNTAFAILVGSLAALLMAIARRSLALLLASLCGALILIVVLVVLAGYAFDVPLARAWGERTPMALMTAVVLALIALSLIGTGWRAWTPLSVRGRALALVSGLAAVGVAFAGWLVLDSRLARGLEQRADAEADHVVALIERGSARHLGLLPALARRLQAQGSAPTVEDFLREAEIHLDVFEVSHVIAWIDPQGVLRVLASPGLPPENLDRLVGTSALLDEARIEAIGAVLSRQEPVLSAPTLLMSTGESAFLLFAPVLRQGEVVGMVGGAIGIERLFSDLLQNQDVGVVVAARYRDDVLWRSAGAPDSRIQFLRARSVTLYGQTFDIAIGFDESLVRSLRGNLPEIVLMVGLLAAGLVSLALALAGLAREQSRLAEERRRSLELSEAQLRQDIVERAQARRVLADSEARHRGIVEASLDGIVTIDAEGRITEFNPAAETMFGYSRDEVLDADMAETIIPESLRQRHREGLQRHLDSGRTNILGKRLQMTALHRDGSEFPVELAIRRIGCDDPPSFTGFIRDITLRLRAERDLERQAQIIDQIHDAVAEVDMDGIVRSWNKGSERMLGYSADEMIGSPIDRVYPPEFLDQRHEKVIVPLLAAGEHSVEVEHVHKDGSRLWVHLSLTLLRDAQGRPTGSLGYSIDITRRHLAEEGLRLSQRAIESSANGIVIVDALAADLPIRYVNPAFERITGYPAAEARGRNCRFLQGSDRDQPALSTIRKAVRESRGCRVLLRNYRRDGTLFWNELQIAPVQDDRGQTTHFVGVQNDVTEQRNHELILEHRANHDLLTGLPNRQRMLVLIGESIAAAHAQGNRMEIVLVNLDRLHQVNDALGYAVGDAVILEAATRLRRLGSRSGAILGRIGGDEFLLVHLAAAGESADSGLADRAISELSRPYEVPGQRVFLTASTGVSLYPEAAQDAVTLVAYADIAVKRAKQRGRNQTVAFSREMAAELADRVRVGAALRSALVSDELSLQLQPLINPRDGSVNAAEALMRWNSADLGAVSPARFVPVAEDSGLIVVLGDWALRAALDHAVRWRGFDGAGGVPVSVNVSAVQFQRPEFVREVEDALHEAGLPATALKLEITESVVMEDAQQAIELLEVLRHLGVRISLDDFGTGHSSLAYLRHLPIDEIKIDRVFVQDVVADPYAASLCRAIIAMSAELGLSIVAEGVETEAQARFLGHAGCTLLQGFLFSRPLPAEDFENMMRKGARWNLAGEQLTR